MFRKKHLWHFILPVQVSFLKNTPCTSRSKRCATVRGYLCVCLSWCDVFSLLLDRQGQDENTHKHTHTEGCSHSLSEWLSNVVHSLRRSRSVSLPLCIPFFFLSLHLWFQILSPCASSNSPLNPWQGGRAKKITNEWCFPYIKHVKTFKKVQNMKGMIQFFCPLRTKQRNVFISLQARRLQDCSSLLMHLHQLWKKYF